MNISEISKQLLQIEKGCPARFKVATLCVKMQHFLSSCNKKVSVLIIACSSFWIQILSINEINLAPTDKLRHGRDVVI